MKKITLFFMSMFVVLATAMAKDEESAEFGIQYMTPQDGAKVTAVYNVILGFSKDVTVEFPEGGIDVVNNTTNEVVKITRVYSDEWAPKNQVTFLFEQETVAGKDGKDEKRDKIIETPGTYSYTIPAGVIKSVDGEEFPETTFTFSIVSTFSLADYSPRETTSLETIQLTFEKEIVEVKMPSSGLAVNDYYYTQFIYVNEEVTISEDRKTVTLTLKSPITTPGQYYMEVYQGIFISADGINKNASLSFNVFDPKPSFSTNYANGDRVKELGNLEITFNNVDKVELLKSDAIAVFLPGMSKVTGNATLENKKITVTFDKNLTEDGQYTFYIPAGTFTMDGVENEDREIVVELFTFAVEPLKIVSVTPEAGAVSSLEKIIVKFNQIVSLSWTDDYMTQFSREITLTCGDQEFTLTNASGSALSDQVEYLVNAEWNGFEWASTPITEAGTYTLNLADIIVDYAAEMVTDSWGTYVGTWHGKKGSCEGTYSWTIEEGSAIDSISSESTEQEIYDLLGRRVEKITTAGIYIVNGHKMIVK